MKKYQIIYADPPWKYQRGKSMGTNFQGAADAQYDCMPLEEIKNLPIKDLSDENCILFLWATFPLLKEALEVVEAWGFTYKTLGFSWIKTNKDGSPLFGIGYYTKSNCEVCLLATKGKAHSLVRSNKVSSAIIHPRTEHSRKPDLIRNKIVELCGDIPRIELFARDDGNKNLFGKNRMDGWDVWGNEVKSDIKL